MTRTSSDILDEEGVVRHGYDYNIQAWVENYIVQKCGHITFEDVCAACHWHGEDIRNIPMHENRREGVVKEGLETTIKELERTEQRVDDLLMENPPEADVWACNRILAAQEGLSRALVELRAIKV